MEKPRNGSVTTKRYSPPATPCDRVIQHGAVSAEEKTILAKRRATLDGGPYFGWTTTLQLYIPRQDMVINDS